MAPAVSVLRVGEPIATSPRGDAPGVRAEHDAADLIEMANQGGAVWLSGRRVPQPQRAVGTGGQDTAAIGAVREADDRRIVTTGGRADGLTVGSAPAAQ